MSKPFNERILRSFIEYSYSQNLKKHPKRIRHHRTNKWKIRNIHKPRHNLQYTTLAGNKKLHQRSMERQKKSIQTNKWRQRIPKSHTRTQKWNIKSAWRDIFYKKISTLIDVWGRDRDLNPSTGLHRPVGYQATSSRPLSCFWSLSMFALAHLFTFSKEYVIFSQVHSSLLE